jgi:hypothetical protein
MGTLCSKQAGKPVPDELMCDPQLLFQKSVPAEIIQKILEAYPEGVLDELNMVETKGSCSYYSSIGQPLHAAAIHGRLDIVEILLEHSAPINWQYNEVSCLLTVLLIPAAYVNCQL